MALTDLTNTKWLFNNSISSYEDVTYHINFISNGTSFSQLISIEGNHSVHYDSTSVYSRDSWVNEAYKTIAITGGTDVTNANLISWLESNATQVIETTTDIVIGSNTLTGVDTIKLTDASDDSNKIDFTYGATPSGTINVKLGENTLVGVNEISVRGTDNISKSFGYVSTPSGFTISIDVIMWDVGYDYCKVYLNGDDTTSYNIPGINTFTNVTSIKFDANVSVRNSDYSADYNKNVWYEIDADTTIHLVGND